MLKYLRSPQGTGIEQGTWYYFTTDLELEGFASFTLRRFIDVCGDRRGAVVQFLDRDYFCTRDLLLVPYSRKPEYFRAGPQEVLFVWTFDASALGAAQTVDISSGWPHNILDKGAITPSRACAQKWTQHGRNEASWLGMGRL